MRYVALIGGLAILLFMAACGDGNSIPASTAIPGSSAPTNQPQGMPTTTPSPQPPGSITPVPASESYRLDLGVGVVVSFVEGLSPEMPDKVAYVTHVPSGSQAVLDRDGQIIDRHDGRGDGPRRLDAVLQDRAAMGRIVEGLKNDEDVRPRETLAEWAHSVQFGGITYLAKGGWFGPMLANGERAMTADDLGPVQAVLIGIDTAWEVHSVSPSGRTVQLLPKRTGVLAGRAVTFGGGNPIAGATVKVEPGGFETQTAGDGSFRLEVYEGILWKLLVTKDGFIPYAVRFYSNRRFGLDQDEERILVRPGMETSHTAELFEIPDDKSGTVLLRDHGSFYGALGLTFRNQVLGDFVFETWLVGFPEGDRFQGSVCACKEGQRGVLDLGDQGSKPLEDIPIVPFGYTPDYVELREGSVYLVRAREGLEGHFLIFRVLSRTEDGIEISYLFR